MALFNSIKTLMPQMQFLPTGSVQQLGPEAYMTPQEKYLAEKARRGDMMQQAQTQLAGTGNIHPQQGGPTGGATAAGGVPTQGGGAPPQGGGLPEDLTGQAAGALKNGSGGLMQSIIKFLPMLMGG